MKALITGVAGFIGSNLAEALLNQGHSVYGYDNFSTGLHANIKNLDVRMVGDITDLKVDEIFHLGLPSSTGIYRDDPFKVADATKVTLRVLELARKNNAHVVYASSSSLYNGHEPPHHEGLPIKVTDYYTEARYFVERLFELYSKFFGVTSVGLRFFSVYGKRDAGKKQFANTITQFALDMLRKKSPIIYGDGNQTRDFTYVDDVVRAIILASSHKTTDIFNIGTGQIHTANQVIDTINKTLSTNIAATHIENPLKNYVFHTRADITKAEQVLGFKAQWKFEDAIEHHVAHLKEVIAGLPVE